MKLSQLLSFEHGLRVICDGDFTNVGTITDVRHDLFTFIGSEKYISDLKSNHSVSCVITNQACSSLIPSHIGCIVSEDPRLSFYKLHNNLVQETAFYGPSIPSEIHETAIVHPTAYVAEKDVIIGPNCTIGPGSVILEGSVLHSNVLIDANCTIGSDGMEYKREGEGFIRIVHVGKTILHEHVEIHSNASIARGLFEDVCIKEHTKVGSLTRIGHGVQIGKRGLIGAHAVIGGSVLISDDVTLGLGVVISNGVKIQKNANVLLGSVVVSNVKENEQVAGNFAIERKKFFQFIHSIR
jgi:UDP-3-O-[3-hydroxymyristoyl] glucosamine N-acyltransferase